MNNGYLRTTRKCEFVCVRSVLFFNFVSEISIFRPPWMLVHKMKTNKMVMLIIKLWLCFNGAVIVYGFQQSGFIVTAPHSFLVNSIEHVCVSLHNNTTASSTGTIAVNVTLTLSSASNILYRSTSVLNKGVTCLDVAIPYTEERFAKLIVQLSSSDSRSDLNTNTEQLVVLQHNGPLVVISPNKPVYKPGENLVFRVLTLTYTFRQLHNKTWTVWIESPAKIRLHQWRNYTINGLAHFEFPLADEPDLGEYSLKVEDMSTRVVTEKLVLIKEYVLPKFEVIITPPPRILADTEQVVWKICSKYGYGEAVRGDLHIRVVVEAEGDSSLPEINHVTKLDDYSGCENFTLSSQDIGLSDVDVRPRALSLTATVTERGTGVALNSTITSRVLDSAFALHFQCSQYFKPGISYKGKIMLKGLDGFPVTTVDEKIQVCVKTRSRYQLAMRLLNCWNYTSDFSGQVVFTLPPLPQPQDIQLIVITATAVDYPSKHYRGSSLVMMVQPTASQNIRPWYSPTSSYIEVTTRQPVRCGVVHSAYVRYTVANISDPTPLFFYLVESRGDILFLRSIHPKSETVLQNSNTIEEVEASTNTIHTKSWRLPLRIVPEMAPSSRLTVYYVRSDGEIVAASMPILVDHCFPNKVRVRWSELKTVPESQVSMNIRASPYSLCSVSTIDHRVHFNTAPQKSAADELWAYVNEFRHRFPPRDSHEYCYNKHQLQIDEEPPSYDLKKRKRSMMLPPNDSSMYVDAITAFDDGGIRVLSNLVLETRPCDNSYDKYPSFERSASPSALENMQVVTPNSGSVNEITSQRLNKNLERYFFPEAWIWETIRIGKQGEVIMNMTTPHSLTSWDTSIMCTSDKEGFGIGSTAMLTTWLPFFLQMDTPYAVRRREKVYIKISVYNYKYHNIPVKLDISSDEGLYVSSLHTAAVACISDQSSWTHIVTVEALQLGKFNLTVTASVDTSVDGGCGPPEIFPAKDTLRKQLLVRAEGFPIQKSQSALLCGQEPTLTWNLNVPISVTGSVAAKLNVVGDLLGPALQKLDKLVDKPTGCGEQNMVILAPNVYFVRYIDAKHRDRNVALRETALKNIIKGYQHQLTFQRPDGSYSAFGKKDEVGSMWLTAFVVKTLGESRNLITVDEANLQTSVSWIISKQLENGCFLLIGNVFHKDMQGGLPDDESSPALTAYIMLSLTASGLQIRPSVLSSATTCIVKSMDAPDIYTLALSTLALARLAQTEKANEMLQRLLTLANTDNDLLHWEKPDSSLAFSVEVTSYAVLSLLALGGPHNLVMANKAVRWIAAQVNANGGFVSTQDTVVALEALTKYALTVPGTDNVELRIIVNSRQLLEDESFHVNQDNRLVQQTLDIPVVPTTLAITALGEGCALVQYVLKYNTESVEGSDAFELHVTTRPLSTVDPCGMQKLEICARYLLPDYTSNMAVLTVMMITGYKPDRESLHQITNVKQWEVEADQVVFYLDSVGRELTCFNMILVRKVNIVDALPAVVSLFDYYYPERMVSTDYRFHCNNIEPLDTIYKPVAAAQTIEPMMGEDPYANFHNVDFELATPDGIEGPVAAYACPPNVKPPQCHIPPVSPKNEE